MTLWHSIADKGRYFSRRGYSWRSWSYLSFGAARRDRKMHPTGWEANMQIYISNASRYLTSNSATLDFAHRIQLLRKLFWALRSPVHDYDYAMAIEDRGPQVEAAAITFLVLSWIMVCLRCYVKLYMIKLFGINDWLAVLSLVWLVSFRNWVKLIAW